MSCEMSLKANGRRLTSRWKSPWLSDSRRSVSSVASSSRWWPATNSAMIRRRVVTLIVFGSYPQSTGEVGQPVHKRLAFASGADWPPDRTVSVHVAGKETADCAKGGHEHLFGHPLLPCSLAG